MIAVPPVSHKPSKGKRGEVRSSEGKRGYMSVVTGLAL